MCCVGLNECLDVVSPVDTLHLTCKGKSDHLLGDNTRGRNRTVVPSTVASGRINVEIGFIAARTRIMLPLLIPPSIPPALLVSRSNPPPAG